MKNYIRIFAILSLIIFASCSTQNPVAIEKVNALLQNKEFTFVAERANPTDFSVNNVINNLPNTSAGQMFNLDPGYTIEIKKDSLEVSLPYFGRMYIASMNSDKNSYRFTSTDFSITKGQEKKDSIFYTITPKDNQNVQTIRIQVYNNGKAYATITANDRATISYDGYITANSKDK